MRALAFSGALVASSLAAAPAALAAEDAPVAQDSTEAARDRVERACMRIPLLTDRTDRIITRIEGDADTRGSLAWLDERIARAEERGFENRVAVLQARHEVREAALPVFELRRDHLEDLAERCREAGVER